MVLLFYLQNRKHKNDNNKKTEMISKNICSDT